MRPEPVSYTHLDVYKRQVVTHDIPPYVIAAGNPCEVIRSITQEDVHKKW